MTTGTDEMTHVTGRPVEAPFQMTITGTRTDPAHARAIQMADLVLGKATQMTGHGPDRGILMTQEQDGDIQMTDLSTSMGIQMIPDSRGLGPDKATQMKIETTEVDTAGHLQDRVILVNFTISL